MSIINTLTWLQLLLALGPSGTVMVTVVRNTRIGMNTAALTMFITM